MLAAGAWIPTSPATATFNPRREAPNADPACDRQAARRDCLRRPDHQQQEFRRESSSCFVSKRWRLTFPGWRPAAPTPPALDHLRNCDHLTSFTNGRGGFSGARAASAGANRLLSAVERRRPYRKLPGSGSGGHTTIPSMSSGSSRTTALPASSLAVCVRPSCR